MKALSIGSRVPSFSTTDENGAIVSDKSLLGKKWILFFYPKDKSPTCTIEACNLRDHYKEIKKAGYLLFGISPDTEKSHQKFIEKEKLPYSLLADTSKKVHEQFGVWGWKILFGRNVQGTLRTTFIINEKGIIEHIISDVKSKQHYQQIEELIGK